MGGGCQARQIALFPEDRVASAQDCDVMHCGSTVCGCAGRGDGVRVGWLVICGINFSWTISGWRGCQRPGKGHDG
jgi:hypothetical protein